MAESRKRPRLLLRPRPRDGLLQERDEEQSKLAAVLKDMAAASTAGSKRQEKISDVCRDLKESKKKIAEIEALVAKAEKLKKHTAFFSPPATHLCLSTSPHAQPLGGRTRGSVLLM